jgi:phosphohistidine phosphatase
MKNMGLYLVQHGKNLPKEEDPEKGLSAEGTKEVERIAQTAKTNGVRVSSVKHSGKKRARQTAEILASALTPSEGIMEIEGLAPLDNVATLAESLNPAKDVMLVGHLPFMEKLTAYLITGSTDRPVIKFQNGGIVCLDKARESDSWIIKWSLMPHMG